MAHPIVPLDRTATPDLSRRDLRRARVRVPRTLVLLLAAIWGLAYGRLFLDPTPRLPLLFNVTASLPYTVALKLPGGGPYARGDFVVYAFAGDARRAYPGLAGQPFFKRIRGIAGDRVTVCGRMVYVNDEAVGVAKPHTFDGRPLAPIAATVIPPGHVYVQGSSADSFDSRYRASGLVREQQILARVQPLF